jgi:DNA topoisomerase I
MKIIKRERILLDAGYRKAYQPVEKEPLTTKANSKLRKLKRGQRVQARQVRVRSKAPGLSEAQLLRALATQGIGRPSTYAEIVSELLKRKYVRQNGKQLVLTPRGVAIQGYLSRAFPALFALKFSGDLERKLDALAEGKVSYQSVVQQVWDLVE